MIILEMIIMMITLIDDAEEEDWWQMLNDTHATCGCTLSFTLRGGPKVRRLRKDAAGESKKSPTLSNFHVEGMIMAWFDHGIIWHVNVRRNKLNLIMFSENAMM